MGLEIVFLGMICFCSGCAREDYLITVFCFLYVTICIQCFILFNLRFFENIYSWRDS